MVVVGWKLVQIGRGPIYSSSAPDFTLTTFGGERYTLSDYAGRVVVINFWASWCKPCEQEAADQERVWTEALEYLEKWGVTYPNGPDLRTEISQAYRIRGVPETYIVDKHGELAQPIIGPVTRDQLASIIARLLSE